MFHKWEKKLKKVISAYLSVELMRRVSVVMSSRANSLNRILWIICNF